MRICKNCNKQYENYYLNSNGCKYTAKTDFCSKSCKTIYQKGSITKEKIEQEIIDYITYKNSYCSLTEILKNIKRSGKTISKFNISIVDIQNQLGFTKPKSVFQEKIYTELKKLFSDIECEKTFDNLLSPKGFNLKLDFYIKNKNLVIEADGNQHTDINNPWYSIYYNNCDKIKNNYCINNSINLVRIPYKKKITTQYILKYLQNFI